PVARLPAPPVHMAAPERPPLPTKCDGCTSPESGRPNRASGGLPCETGHEPHERLGSSTASSAKSRPPPNDHCHCQTDQVAHPTAVPGTPQMAELVDQASADQVMMAGCRLSGEVSILNQRKNSRRTRRRSHAAATEAGSARPASTRRRIHRV